MRYVRGKLTYANVVATVAVFIALGGAGYAAVKLPKNSVGTRQIKNHAVTGAKIKIATLGTVPRAAVAARAGSAESASHATSADSASHAGSADSAAHAGSATTAESAGHAASADTARDAESLAGLPAGSYARDELEPIHVVGTPGEPGFEGGCESAGGDFGQVGFYKDGFGIVHLVGVASCPTTVATVFTLPPGFRPAVDNLAVVAMGETTTGEVGVVPDGEVRVFGGGGPRLFGVTFRAGS